MREIELEFVLRSVQYTATSDLPADPPGVPVGSSTPIGVTLRFPDGHVVALPAAPAFMGSASRVDLTGTAAAGSDGGIVLPPGSRIAVTPDNYGGDATYLASLGVSILFTGVLRYYVGPDGQPVKASGLAPRALFSANQNILAPETQRGFQCYPETPAGYRDEPFTAISPDLAMAVRFGGGTQVPHSQEFSGSFALPGGSEFVWRGFDWYVSGITALFGLGLLVVPLNVAGRIRTADGRVLNDNLVDLFAMAGPVFPEIPLRAGSRIFYDLAVAYCDPTLGAPLAGTVSARLVFHGVRRYRL